MHMDDLAVKYRGKVVKVTSYCFWWETLPVTKTTVYMKSYFMEGVH